LLCFQQAQQLGKRRITGLVVGRLKVLEGHGT
jgi:hypothetical protein